MLIAACTWSIDGAACLALAAHLLTACLSPAAAPPCLPQVVRQPDDSLLALLLGNAMGVMLLLSVWEM